MKLLGLPIICIQGFKFIELWGVKPAQYIGPKSYTMSYTMSFAMACVVTHRFSATKKQAQTKPYDFQLKPVIHLPHWLSRSLVANVCLCSLWRHFPHLAFERFYLCIFIYSCFTKNRTRITFVIHLSRLCTLEWFHPELLSSRPSEMHRRFW